MMKYMYIDALEEMYTANDDKKKILEKLTKEMQERLNQKIENVQKEIQTLLNPENTL